MIIDFDSKMLKKSNSVQKLIFKNVIFDKNMLIYEELLFNKASYFV